MSNYIQDDRDKGQKITHPWLITAMDSLLSGWGRAGGGKSRVAWACKPEDIYKVLAWVEKKEEMKYVNLHYNKDYRPRNFVHLHIYVITNNHAALK